MPDIKYDFSGWATKNDLKCGDGRVIRKDAFKHCDGMTVPLVYQHLHNSLDNILGHAMLENRPEGVYTYATFNSTAEGQKAKELVEHGDIRYLSIYANQLKQQGGDVLHGTICEVSLVLKGANPGATIQQIAFQHDGLEEVSEEDAIIKSDSFMIEVAHSDIYEETDVVEHVASEAEVVDVEEEPKEEPVNQELSHALAEDATVKEAFQSAMTKLEPIEQDVVYAVIGVALEAPSPNEMKQSITEGDDTMKTNVFESAATLSHSEFNQMREDIFAQLVPEARRLNSIQEAWFQNKDKWMEEIAHAGTYGINDIDLLFPDARLVNGTPAFVKRDTGWVAGVLAETTHSPFSRIKSTAADITEDEARAKGYITGAEKVNEVFNVLRRITTPQTIYKKQKLDRDDILDITDFDVVAWIKAEMRLMLDEEIARAILVGDGRDTSSPDKIMEANVRPIYKDESLYVTQVEIPADADTEDVIDAFIRSREYWKGTGVPTLYTTTKNLADMSLSKDSIGRRMYSSVAEIASLLRVSKIVEVPVMEGLTRPTADSSGTKELVGIIVNLTDYTVGADRGGQVSMFDDFDIDFNQQKYLIETRISGALVVPKSALVFEKVLPVGP